MKLKYQLSDDTTDRNLDLINLMKICKTNSKILNVVCIGAGDVFINRYWLPLEKYITRGVDSEYHEKRVKIKLLVCDQLPLEELVRDRAKEAEKLSKKAENKIKNAYENFVNQIKIIDKRDNDDKDIHEIKYINLKDKNEKKWYIHQGATIVFILIPDGVHIKYAKEWFRRATLMIIEKPYNRQLEEASDFEDLINEFTSSANKQPITWVIPFDHYLAKIKGLALEPNQEKYFESIGALRNVEFQLTESRQLEPWRAETLEEGLIYDLFSHILALLTICIDLQTYRADYVVKFFAGKHEGSPITKETFAFIDFRLKDYKSNQVRVKGSIGKGISRDDKKFIKFIGEEGYIICRFAGKNKGPGIYRKIGDGIEAFQYNIREGHRELIEHILDGKFRNEPIGGLTGSEAIQIMKIMNSFRERIENKKLASYKIGMEPEDIIKIEGAKISKR